MEAGVELGGGRKDAGPDFIASYWTLAGNAHPGHPDRHVSPHSLEERVICAARAGYRGMGLYEPDLAAIRKNPRWASYGDIALYLRDHGLDTIELEVVPDWFAAGAQAETAAPARHTLMEAAEKMGAAHLKVLGDVHFRHSPQAMMDGFGKLCEDARRSGTRVALELTPLTNLETLAQGVALVQGAGGNNAGLLLDLWHMSRAGIPWDDIAHLPRGMVIGAELDDADVEVRGTLLEDTMNNRKLPGKGAFECRRFIEALSRAGFEGPYGIEIVAQDHRSRPIAEAAYDAISAARAQFN
jgi:sugar phosphate isomerase/epimerase